MMKYINGENVQAGDVFTDGGENNEATRLKVRAKVLYVDKFVLVWFPLNDFSMFDNGAMSQTFGFRHKKKVTPDELTEPERVMYDSSDSFLHDSL